ncbi:hypothetical protein TUBRATIS_004320 [Tubulinosema ratisbonensis]|uniref:Uncharacterized protein n=1 Tax=Tubulinosema ratisbonensis TaxID=291195 RepID=A0A437AP79_9MICR|nr:hypothetical protein TUBRATIS_004320 [Tubulinosema ratisbonensis]
MQKTKLICQEECFTKSNKKEILSLLKAHSSLTLIGNKKELLNTIFFYTKQNKKKTLVLCLKKQTFKNMLPDFIKREEISYWPESSNIILADITNFNVSKSELHYEISVAGKVKDLVMLTEPDLIVLDKFKWFSGLFNYFNKQICMIKEMTDDKFSFKIYDSNKENQTNLIYYLLINKNNLKKRSLMEEKKEEKKEHKIYVPKVNIEEIEKQFERSKPLEFRNTDRLTKDLSRVRISERGRRDDKSSFSKKSTFKKEENNSTFKKEENKTIHKKEIYIPSFKKEENNIFNFIKNDKSNINEMIDNLTEEERNIIKYMHKSIINNTNKKNNYELKKQNKILPKITFIKTDLFCEEVVKQIKPNITTLILTPDDDKDLLYLQKEIASVLRENKIKYNLRKENNLVSLNCKKKERHQMIINLGVPSLKDFKEFTKMCDEFVILIRNKEGIEEIIEYMMSNGIKVPDWLIYSEEEEEIDDSDLWN